MRQVSIETGMPLKVAYHATLADFPLHRLELGQSLFVSAENKGDRRELRASLGRLAYEHSLISGRSYIVSSLTQPMGVRVWLYSVPAAVMISGRD